MMAEDKKYFCKQCDIYFPSRKELGKHIYDVHNPTKDKPKKHKIPMEFIDELKYLNDGAYVKVSAEGQLIEGYLEVDRFKYL